MPDNKNIGKLFSKYKLLFLDQINSSSDPSQTLMLQFPISRASLIISVKFYPSQLKPFFNTIFTMFLIGFPILSYPIRPQVTTSIRYTKAYAKSNLSKFIVKLYADHKNVLIKHARHQKAESLRSASLSKLENTIKNNYIFNTKYTEFSIKS